MRMCYNTDMKKRYLIKTKYGNFNAQIWKSRDGFWLAEVPSFNKTMTQGVSLADAKDMVEDMIEVLCEVAFADGKIVIDDERHIVGRGKLARLQGPILVAA